MKKQYRLVLVLVLITSMFFIEGVESESTNDFTLNSVSFDRTTATVDETVTISINGSGSSYPIQYIGLELHYWDNNSGYYQYLEWLWIDVEFDGMQTTYTIGQYDPDTHLIIGYVSMEDGYGNYESFYLNDTFSPSLDIYGTTPDFDAPTLHWISASPANVTGYDYLNVKANVTDDLTGTSYVYFEIFEKYDNTTYLYDNRYVNGYNLDFNESSGLWEAIIEVGIYWPTGTYYIPYVASNDYNGNYISYYNSSSFTNTFDAPQIYVFNENGDITPPVLHDFWFATSEAPAGGYVEVTANATDDVSGIDYMYMELSYLDQGDQYYAGWGDLQVDNKTGLLSGRIQIFNEVLENTTLFVNYISIRDVANNWISYYNGSDFASPTIKVNGTVFEPVLNDMWFNTDVASSGSQFEMYIDMYNEYSTITYLYAELAYIQDNNTYYAGWSDLYLDTTSGLFVGTVYLNDIPEGYSVFVNYLHVSDEFGNSVDFYNGEDFNSPLLLIENAPEEIILHIWPNWGESQTGESVNFEVGIESSFRHNMYNLELRLEVENIETTEITYYTSIIDLPAQSWISEFFDVFFEEVGSYNIYVILIDDIGEMWSYEMQWNVVGDNISDPTDNSEPTNSSIGPDFNLPGFEIPLTILSFGFMIITSYKIRRRN